MRKFKILLLIGVLFCMPILSGCTDSSYLESVDASDNEASGDKESGSSDSDDKSFSEGKSSKDGSDEDAQKSGKLCVHVAGAVNSPGVYELPCDARVFQAIEAAGGLTDDADDRDLNQAEHVADGEKLYVYTIGEKQAEPEAVSADDCTDDGRININTASAEELTQLSGIGESKAAAIITYRESNGGFAVVEDLMKVDGIGEGTYNKLKDCITI